MRPGTAARLSVPGSESGDTSAMNFSMEICSSAMDGISSNRSVDGTSNVSEASRGGASVMKTLFRWWRGGGIVSLLGVTLPSRVKSLLTKEWSKSIRPGKTGRIMGSALLYAFEDGISVIGCRIARP